MGRLGPLPLTGQNVSMLNPCWASLSLILRPERLELSVFCFCCCSCLLALPSCRALHSETYRKQKKKHRELTLVSFNSCKSLASPPSFHLSESWLSVELFSQQLFVFGGEDQGKVSLHYLIHQLEVFVAIFIITTLYNIPNLLFI